MLNVAVAGAAAREADVVVAGPLGGRPADIPSPSIGAKRKSV